MSSGKMPRRTHHAESLDKRARALVAKGTPLSVRIRFGSPYSLNSRVKVGFACSTAVDARARHLESALLFSAAGSTVSAEGELSSATAYVVIVSTAAAMG